MWHFCVGNVMDVVFSVCIVRRGALGARVRVVLFILRSRLLLYSAGSGVNRV